MSHDYKDTLNLPNTAFPMKANLTQREPELLKHWDSIELYKQLQTQGKGKSKFILSDGPPFANGPIHIGHAMNKILKDFIVKSKILSGFDAPYIPGWDCHGLPIELNVEKQIGKPGVKVDAKIFRHKCREYVLKQIDLQRDAFIRLGILGDWKNPYLTMNYQYEADIIRSLAKIASNGHLHKGYKPVHWCVDCGSALAESEVEYQDKTSPSIYVGFIVNDKRWFSIFELNSEKESAPSWVVIWTTTPWTLPANQAVAVHPEYRYALIKVKDKTQYYLVGAELVQNFMQQLGLTDYQIIKDVLGSELEGIKLKHPFFEREVPMVLGEHVTLDSGTGNVHTAPAHGQDDFALSEKYDLSIDNPVGSDGCYISTTPIFAGIHVLKANERVLEE